jgi:hypothetical protein
MSEEGPDLQQEAAKDQHVIQNGSTGESASVDNRRTSTAGEPHAPREPIGIGIDGKGSSNLPSVEQQFADAAKFFANEKNDTTSEQPIVKDISKKSAQSGTPYDSGQDPLKAAIDNSIRSEFAKQRLLNDKIAAQKKAAQDAQELRTKQIKQQWESFDRRMKIRDAIVNAPRRIGRYFNSSDTNHPGLIQRLFPSRQSAT